MRADARTASSGRMWVIGTAGGPTVRGYLPGWADVDPSRTGVPPEALHIALSDITHQAAFGGQLLHVVRGAELAEESVGLVAYVECRPVADDSGPCGPVVSVQIVDDWWIRDLDPAAVSETAARFRAFADLLDGEVAPALADAIAEWTTHGAPVQIVNGSSPSGVERL
ncbi:DUF6907 domain-containing protein [Actinacidiphila bryophytorum]|uniref:DUF6907 domain-containing protein n=1 Tax=Actinacidiphila bryophytorum TaxID=1436133 RepID=UPI002176DE7E|nr:hypothetical protein [Actinacidiphila bryophytorum]UWE07496.1 hypothetical protein NYE86_01280 [Actinacidiphila bryophytorum]